jgi:uncharacterized protein (DUF488 family)
MCPAMTTAVSPRVFTIGHSTHALTEFVALLSRAGVEMVVDVRRLPHSRHNPQFDREALAGSLPAAGIAYRPMPALGGRRRRPKGAPPSPNGLWRNESFRNYADYALGEAFRTGLDELCDLVAERPLALMCAEALWWRCHRRIIADHLLARATRVSHILADGKIEPASLTPGARLDAEGRLIYPPDPAITEC